MLCLHMLAALSPRVRFAALRCAARLAAMLRLRRVMLEFASFRLLDRLFSRLGSADDCANSSTFTTECRELASMLQHATKNSLCIIDELVRAFCCCVTAF